MYEIVWSGSMKWLLALSAVLFMLTGCSVSTSAITKGEYYPHVYQNHPKSILVLPAKNTTTAVDAADHFRYTITKPLAEKGYYVFPVQLVDAFFKSENLSDAEAIRNIPTAKLKEIFDADAVLYVDINAWDTGYTVFTSNVDVGLSFSLVETKTGYEIWQNNAYAYSYEGLDGNNGIVGLVVSAIATAMNTATDYTKLSNVANQAGTSMLPSGIYGPDYKKDADAQLNFLDTAELEDGRIYVNEYFIFGNKESGKVPLTVRAHQRGYFAFSVTNMNAFNHNGYGNYYITQEIHGKKFLRNRFFLYEDMRPYLLIGSKKVFVMTEVDGTIPFSNDNGKYYFQVDRIVELKKITKS